METRESMHTGDLPAEQTLPSHLNPNVGVQRWLPYPSLKNLFFSAPTEAALKDSHLGQESCKCWEKIQSSHLQGQGRKCPALQARTVFL